MTILVYPSLREKKKVNLILKPLSPRKMIMYFYYEGPVEMIHPTIESNDDMIDLAGIDNDDFNLESSSTQPKSYFRPPPVHLPLSSTRRN